MKQHQGFRVDQIETQRGQIMILTVFILAMGAGWLVFGAAENRTTDSVRNKRTNDALAMARDALMGRSLSDENHPGSLPCPDAITTVPNNIPGDGIADLLAGTNCPRNIGRLPWKTLGLPDLRDGDGEPLWYMLSPVFNDGGNAINTDTLSNLTVYTGNSSSVMATQVAAVVFAPGAPINNQVRSPTQTAACAVAGATVAQTMCASNYLETLSGINNASNSGPYITGVQLPVFNDRLVVIASVDVLRPIEFRAMVALFNALRNYQEGSMLDNTRFCFPDGCYPWADVSDGQANDGLTFGRVPLIDAGTSGDDNDWSDAGVTIPQWLLDNDWRLVFFYAVAPMQTFDHGPGWLSVDGVSNKHVVLISTGVATAARTNFPFDYIEDPENSDNDAQFVTPIDFTSKNRDRIGWLP